MTVWVASPTPGNSPTGAEDAPYSLSTAISMALPGDTVLLRGVFTQPVSITKSGTPGAPITYAMHPDKAAIDGKFIWPKPSANAVIMKAPDGVIGHWGPLVNIQADDIAWSVDVRNSLGRGIGVQGKRVTLRDALVDWTRNGAINIQNSEEIRVLNMRWSHSGSYYQGERDPNLFNWPVACYVQRTNGVEVRGCTGFECWGEGLAFGRGTINGFAHYNTIYDVMSVGMYGDRCRNCEIWNNTIYCTGTFGNVGPSEGLVVRNENYNDGTPPMTGFRAIDNLIVHVKKGIVIGRSEKVGELMSNVLLDHNTLVDCTDVSIFHNSADHRGVAFVNNLVHQKNGEFVRGSGVKTGEYTVSHNGWGGIENPQISPLFTSPTDIYGVRLVNPGATILPGMLYRDNYAPVANYEGIGAIQYIPPVVEPPIIENESVRIILEGSLSPDKAAAFRKMIADGKFFIWTE